MDTTEQTHRFITRVARDAGAILMQHKTGPLEKIYKGTEGDFATNADIASQHFILDALAEAFPNDGIIAEEEGLTTRGSSEYTWIIDPLDGTRNFASGNEHFAVMIARADSLAITDSALYFPVDDTLIVAHRNMGTYINDALVTLTLPGTLREVRACLAHTNPEAYTTPAMDALRSQLPATGFEACTLFSSAANTRSILEGKHDAFIIPSNCTWDNCAPALLLMEAGLRVTAWNRDPIHPRLGTQHLLAAPPKVYNVIQHTLSSFMPQ